MKARSSSTELYARVSQRGCDVAHDQPRDVRGACAIVEQHDPLARSIGAREDVPDLEPYAEARSRRLGDEHIAAREPVEIAAEHGFLGELRLRRLDVVVEQVRGEHVVAVATKPFADRAPRGDATAIAANRAREIDTHSLWQGRTHVSASGLDTWVVVYVYRFNSSRTRSIGIASPVPLADRTVVA